MVAVADQRPARAAVARVVLTAAAKHLAPVTLELGGKSLDLTITARCILHGKFFNNAGGAKKGQHT